MTTLSGSGASVLIASGAAVSFTNEATTGNAGRTAYAINDATKRYWDDTASFTVQTSPDGSTWTTATAGTYTVQHVGGIITFGSARAAGTQVRVSGSYFTTTTVGQASEWSLQLTLDTTEVSTFGSTFKVYLPTKTSATGSVTEWWLDGTFAALMGSRIILSLGTGAGRYEGYGYWNKESVKAATGDAISESLDFTFTGQVFYNA